MVRVRCRQKRPVEDGECCGCRCDALRAAKRRGNSCSVRQLTALTPVAPTTKLLELMGGVSKRNRLGLAVQRLGGLKWKPSELRVDVRSGRSLASRVGRNVASGEQPATTDGSMLQSTDGIEGFFARESTPLSAVAVPLESSAGDSASSSQVKASATNVTQGQGNDVAETLGNVGQDTKRGVHDDE